MASFSRLDFLNRYCKKNSHEECYGEWEGLGVKVICSCYCHKKGAKASGQVCPPLSDAADSNIRGVSPE
jgi:hypothetical protein